MVRLPYFSLREPEEYPIEPLRPEDVGTVRFGWDSYFDRRSLARHVAIWPRLVWRAGRDYVVGGYWRGREDIGLVMEATARHSRPGLVDRLLECFRAEGCRAVVLSDHEARRDAEWYLGHGWSALDRVVNYELRDCRRAPVLLLTLDVHRFVRADVYGILEVERASFPWLWWNSAAELLRYAAEPGVEVITAHHEGQLVGYLGYSLLGSRGHLDRLAVHQHFQRRGYGAQLLSLGVHNMVGLGVHTVGLSTQSDNVRSQNLYRQFGFRASGRGYSIYGRYL